MKVTEGEKEVTCALINAPWIYRNHMGVAFLRICVGALMLAHGYPKLLMLINGQGAGWMDPIGIGGTLSLALCCFAEFFCSLAIIAGILTRLAALVLVLNFWVVVFFVDKNATWAQTELPALYLVCYITLVCTGAGRFSIDHLVRRKLGCRYAEAPDFYSPASAAGAATPCCTTPGRSRGEGEGAS